MAPQSNFKLCVWLHLLHFLLDMLSEAVGYMLFDELDSHLAYRCFYAILYVCFQCHKYIDEPLFLYS